MNRIWTFGQTVSVASARQLRHMPRRCATCCVLAAALFCNAEAYAAAVLIEPCEKPLTLHVRQVASATRDVLAESFELCGHSASTEYLPLPEDDWEQQLNLFEHGLELRLTRTDSGMRVALKAGNHAAEILNLSSNAPEQSLHWQDSQSPTSAEAPPALRLRVEARPVLTALSRRFKIYALLQPADEIARELARVGKQKVLGIKALCSEKVTLNFEAVDAGTVFGLLADVCERALHAPADGNSLRFSQWQQPPSQPQLANREEELTSAILLARQGYNTQTPVPEALLELAELAAERQDYKRARAYVKRARAHPRSWFGVSNADIDLALARIETRAGNRKLAVRRIEQVLRALDQDDPDKISVQRADALYLRAQLYAADDHPAQAIKTAQAAFLTYEQLPFPADPAFLERKKTLVRLIETSEKQLGN